MITLEHIRTLVDTPHRNSIDVKITFRIDAQEDMYVHMNKLASATLRLARFARAYNPNQDETRYSRILYSDRNKYVELFAAEKSEDPPKFQ